MVLSWRDGGLFFLRQAVYDSTSLGTTGLAGNYLNELGTVHTYMPQYLEQVVL